MIAAEVFLWGTRIGVVMPLSDRIFSFPALRSETFEIQGIKR